MTSHVTSYDGTDYREASSTLHDGTAPVSSVCVGSLKVLCKGDEVLVVDVNLSVNGHLLIYVSPVMEWKCLFPCDNIGSSPSTTNWIRKKNEWKRIIILKYWVFDEDQFYSRRQESIPIDGQDCSVHH